MLHDRKFGWLLIIVGVVSAPTGIGLIMIYAGYCILRDN